MMRVQLPMLFLFIISISAYAQTGRGFGDEFNGNQLDAMKWDVFKGQPTVADDKLTLNGGATRAEIQSERSFLHGALTIEIESAKSLLDLCLRGLCPDSKAWIRSMRCCRAA